MTDEDELYFDQVRSTPWAFGSRTKPPSSITWRELAFGTMEGAQIHLHMRLDHEILRLTVGDPGDSECAVYILTLADLIGPWAKAVMENRRLGPFADPTYTGADPASPEG